VAVLQALVQAGNIGSQASYANKETVVDEIDLRPVARDGCALLAKAEIAHHRDAPVACHCNH
jgi:hypothetical protein